MRAELTLIPTLSIYPDRVCFYNVPNWSPSKPGKFVQEFEKENDLFSDGGVELQEEKTNDKFLHSSRTANGLMSDSAKRKMTKCVDYLLLLSSEKKCYSRITGRQFSMKIAFITLTLPSKQVHSDNEIKAKCLNQFLIEIKKRWKVQHYVWRAEKQKNGNLHFHILIDRYIDCLQMRDIWNRIVEKLGYVTRYRQEMKLFHEKGFTVRKDLLKHWDYKSQLRAYREGSQKDWNSPNSTDIHSIRKVINIKAYVVKYMSKNEMVNPETGEIEETLKDQEGRIWGSDQSLAQAKAAVIEVDNSVGDELLKIMHNDNIKHYDSDYFSVFYISFDELTAVGATDIYQAFADYLIQQFNFNIQKTINYA